MVIEVDQDGHSPEDGYLRAQPADVCVDHSCPTLGYADPIGIHNKADPVICLGRPTAPEEPLGDYAEIEDRHE